MKDYLRVGGMAGGGARCHTRGPAPHSYQQVQFSPLWGVTEYNNLCFD